MRPELTLLKLFLAKDTYDTYRQYIDVSKDEQELKQLYSLLDKAYETYNRSLTYNEFYVFVLSSSVGNQHTLKTILDRLETVEIGTDIAETLLKQIKERRDATEIAKTAIAVSEGKATFTDLQNKIESCSTDQQLIEILDDDFITDDLEYLYTTAVHKHGLRWRLQSLNTMLGSLRKGNFGFIFARPETGKTTFLASEGTHFASQLKDEEGPGIWINNEEAGDQVQIRVIQAALGIDRFTLFTDIPRYKKEYQEMIRGKLRIVDNANLSRREVEKLCEKYNPSFLIFDQLDKIKGFDGDREDLKLGAVYQWAREIAKCYCPVIGVTQADGTGEKKKWLTMENVANAKTAKQAEADWILGIGYSGADGFEYVRHLHASKNKLPGDEDTDPKMRHGKIDVLIQPDIARYMDYV